MYSILHFLYVPGSIHELRFNSFHIGTGEHSLSRFFQIFGANSYVRVNLCLNALIAV